MNKKIVALFVVLLAVLIVLIIARDLISSQPGRNAGNPYKLEIDSLVRVDPGLIGYEEYRQIRLDLAAPAAMTMLDDRIFLVGDQRLLEISSEGRLRNTASLPDRPACITRMDDSLLAIGFRDHFGIFRPDGTPLVLSEVHSDASVFTAIACRNQQLYIADAGNRQVLVYDTEGNFKRAFRGETGDGSNHGFIVPSPNFHLDIDPSGALWVNNPGIHTLQEYDDQGKLLTSWSKSTPRIEGFSGCCNPARFTFLPDGRFVTSEKGLVRIKVYSASGDFESVVAAPDQFTIDGQAPDVVADRSGNILALDTDKRMIRFFKPS